MQGRYRWGLVDGKLPLYERHMRSLLAYGIGVPTQAWVRSRVEWSLDNLDPALRYGVIVVDVSGGDMVDVRIEPSRKQPELDFEGRAAGGELDVLDDGLFWSSDGDSYMHYGQAIAATSTLVRDLAQTLHHEVGEAPAPTGQAFPAESAPAGHGERFFVSDEFGIIALGGHPGPSTLEMMGYLDRLRRGIENPAQQTR